MQDSLKGRGNTKTHLIVKLTFVYQLIHQTKGVLTIHIQMYNTLNVNNKSMYLLSD